MFLFFNEKTSRFHPNQGIKTEFTLPCLLCQSLCLSEINGGRLGERERESQSLFFKAFFTAVH